MIADLVFVFSQIALGLFGAAAAFHPSVRGLSWPARISAAFAAGSVALTVEATLFSLARVPWSAAALSVPLLLVSGYMTLRWNSTASGSHALQLPRTRFPAYLLALSAGGFVYLALSLVSSASTSVDYLLFWGVKAARFAQARGIDAPFLRSAYSAHAVPDYPPLVPILQAWGILASGKMPWRLVPVLSAVWPIAAVSLLFDLFRRRIGAGAAAVVTFWSVAVSFSLADSYSGGNAEAPLLFFETVALAALLTEPTGDASRFLPGIALCGAVLTKVEGTLAALVLIAGAYCRDRLEGRPGAFLRALRLSIGPALGLAVWFAYQGSAGLAVGFRPHGEFLRLYPAHAISIARHMLYSLDAGTLWLAWGLPAAALVVFAKRWKSVLPALALAAGVLGFMAFDYLHDVDDPATRIRWTLPRVSQPALSAVILAAGFATMKTYREEPA